MSEPDTVGAAAESDRFGTPPHGSLSTEQAALYDAITAGPRAAGRQHFPLADDTGRLLGPFGPMLHAPAVGLPLQELGAALRFRTSLPDRIREIAILLVAADAGSTFEWQAHSAIASALGVSDAELAAVKDDSFAPSDDAERAAATFVTALMRRTVPDDETRAHLADALGVAALVEITAIVGYYRLLAQLMDVFRIDRA